MTYEAKIICDSISAAGQRLTTFALSYPRLVHSEFLTHRVFSRNASSSRAIPVKKIIDQVIDNPAMPVYFGKNQKGMQAEEELSPEGIEEVNKIILQLRDITVQKVQQLIDLGLHKQISNRYLESWHYIKVVCTATDWDNFFFLRCHKDAQPEIKQLAEMMRDAYFAQQPTLVEPGAWHLPFIDPNEDLAEDVALKVSTARCARVSYMRHDGTPAPINDDITLHDRLVQAGHMSPAEHQATPLLERDKYSGNFRGWQQYRKQILNENRTGYKSSL
jgi:thymidylate synthase ThyX